jgi:sulfur-oxidizing protein SoxB
MTGHWEFTYGMQRVKEIVEKDFAGKVDFVAQNVKTNDFGDPVFKPYVMKEMNGVKVAIVGQAFPYTPIANPRYMVADWEFGIQDDNMQKVVDEARGKGAQLVVVLSHNGMDVDLKMASRVRGIDAIFGGHTHDGVPVAVPVANAGGTTLVTNAGSNGKFLGVMDFEVKAGKVANFRYRLLPIFSNMLKPTPRWTRSSPRSARPMRPSWPKARRHRRPAVPPRQLQRQLGPAAVRRADGRAGRRDRLQPGLPLGHQPAAGRRDHARTDDGPGGHHLPLRHAHADERRDDQDHSGRRGRQPLQPRPLLPAGRRHGARGRPAVHDGAGREDGLAHQRHAPERQAIEAGKTYKVAGWAPVAEEAAKAGNKPVWDVVETWLKGQAAAASRPRRINTPKLVGVQGNPGLA